MVDVLITSREARQAMDTDQASFERRERHGHITLVVTGEIDVANAPTFLHELIAVATEAHSPTVVDLSAVTFLDSSGLNALVKAHRSLEDSDASLVLLNPSPICRRVLELTGTDRILEIVDDNPAPLTPSAQRP
jgi:anti-anti-sigma factor